MRLSEQEVWKMRGARVRRLEKIRSAQTDLEACLLALRANGKREWTDTGFRNLYYLIRLAKRAP